MTPFGNVLSNFRRKRHMQQQELAVAIGVQPSYISLLETGKKGPPSSRVITQIITVLKLGDDEITELRFSIEKSQRTLRLPTNTSPDEMAFVWALKRRLGSLSNEELQIMTNTLKLGESHR